MCEKIILQPFYSLTHLENKCVIYPLSVGDPDSNNPSGMRPVPLIILRGVVPFQNHAA